MTAGILSGGVQDSKGNSNIEEHLCGEGGGEFATTMKQKAQPSGIRR
jgi:hypothetical protein